MTARGAEDGFAETLPGRMARHLWRKGPALAGIWLLGDIAQSLISWLAVLAGQQNRMAGVAVLTLAILARIVTVVAMFRVVERDAPILRAEAPPPTLSTPALPTPGARAFTHDVAMVLVPFFVYYVAWGLLGDLMRSYGMLSLALDELGRHGPLLDIRPGQAAVVWAGGAWLVRRFAKTMQARQPQEALWPFLVVAAEAMWIFVGIFLISVWKGAVMAFVATLPAPSEWPSLIGAALAADMLPVPADLVPLSLWDRVSSVALYAVLPLVWFNLGAIIRGADIATLDPALQRRAAPLTARWQAMPRVLRDFLDHFVSGTVKRWRAIANAVQAMLAAGLVLLAAVVVGFRLIEWLSAWGIWATMQVIGPLPFEPARMAERGLDLIWGTPRSPGGGLIPEVLKICLISAALDLVARRTRPDAA